MNLNSPLFDRIRVKSEPAARPVADGPACDYPGCAQAGGFRAPKGRNREGEYFCFCIDHVREYNQTYNYFKDMSDEDVSRYQKDAATGHRPTWSMGVKRGAQGFREETFAETASDPFGVLRRRAARRGSAPGGARTSARPAVGIAARKALASLGLDEAADAPMIRTRYKELVKRFHPDANGGDRSREEKLREIIHAYKQLKSARLV